jgi:mannosyltransferase
MTNILRQNEVVDRTRPKVIGRPQDWLVHLAPLIPILVLYLILGLYRLDHKSLWGDEVGSRGAAAPEESFFSATFWQDGHGPLYFAVLHLWMKIGDTEFTLRALSVVFGFFSVCLTYAFGFRLFDRRAAVYSALLFATSPFLIWYSQEIRFITMSIMFSLLTMYTFHWILMSDRLQWWISYCGATLINLFTFAPALFLPLAQGLYLIGFKSFRSILPKWMICQVVVLTLFLCWFVNAYMLLSPAEIREDQDEVPMLNVELLSSGTLRELSSMVIPYTFFSFSTGFSIGPSIRALHISRSVTSLLDHITILLPLFVLFGSLFTLGVWRLSQNSKVGILLIIWLFTPMAAAFAAAAVTDLAYNVRYVSSALPAYILILAVAITALRRRALQLIVLSAVLCVNGLALYNYYFNPHYAREDGRSAARFLEAFSQPRDALLFMGNSTSLDHYYQGSLALMRWKKSDVANPAAIRRHLCELQENYKALWLITIRPWEEDPTGQVKAVLDTMFDIAQHKRFTGVDIYQYQLSQQNRPREHPCAG